MVNTTRVFPGKLLTSGDWWAVWCGLIILAASYISTEALTKPPTILPNRWTSESFNFDATTYAAYVVLVLITIILSFVAIQFVRREALTLAREDALVDWHVDVQLLVGLLSLSIISFAAYLAGANVDSRKFGVTEVLCGLGLGILIRWIAGLCINRVPYITWFLGALNWVSDGEFFIKVGIVVLSLKISTVFNLGVPGILVSWPVVSINIWLIFLIGRWLFGTSHERMVLVLAAGISVCGASAATAVQSAIHASKDDLAAVVTVITLFTVIQMIALPYLIQVLDLPSKVAGAWIGGSIDATGAVVAAAEILDDDEATITAATLKVIQNAVLGLVVVGITILWTPKDTDTSDNAFSSQSTKKQAPDTSMQVQMGEMNDYSGSSSGPAELATIPESADNQGSRIVAVSEGVATKSISMDITEATEINESEKEHRDTENILVTVTLQDKRSPKRKTPLAYLREVWERFPKFVIGFFLTSIIISLLELVLSDLKLTTLQARMKSFSSWWFTLGFTAIGLNINLWHLIATVSKSPMVPLYVVGQVIDLVLTFGAAQIAFNPKLLG